ENWNEINIYENGFLDEFKAARANLRANINAGRGNTFAYFGPGTNTSPLPIYLAHFSAVAPANASNQALYTSTNFTNTSFTGDMDMIQPNVTGNNGATSDLFSSTTFRANMLTAGLPSNF